MAIRPRARQTAGDALSGKLAFVEGAARDTFRGVIDEGIAVAAATPGVTIVPRPASPCPPSEIAFDNNTPAARVNVTRDTLADIALTAACLRRPCARRSAARIRDGGRACWSESSSPAHRQFQVAQPLPIA
jgi:hypothetical protein